jgi:hypothetical protein
VPRSLGALFGRCPCGGGDYDVVTVRASFQVAGSRIDLDAQQGRCRSCGSRVYKADLLQRLESLDRGSVVDPVLSRR